MMQIIRQVRTRGRDILLTHSACRLDIEATTSGLYGPGTGGQLNNFIISVDAEEEGGHNDQQQIVGQHPQRHQDDDPHHHKHGDKSEAKVQTKLNISKGCMNL